MHNCIERYLLQIPARKAKHQNKHTLDILLRLCRLFNFIRRLNDSARSACSSMAWRFISCFSSVTFRASSTLFICNISKRWVEPKTEFCRISREMLRCFDDLESLPLPPPNADGVCGIGIFPIINYEKTRNIKRLIEGAGWMSIGIKCFGHFIYNGN